MAFTEQNKADAYLFFVLAFNAAPGTVYGGQIVEAYESGMTTADIVAQYVEKPAFTNLYPTTQTANEFATALVNNVSSLSTEAAVKAAAVADIETALAAGWTKAQVVTQILGNLANKTVADAEWGATVAQLNNKIAVAKALTEGDLALTTEDAALLQGPLANVTEDVATVQAAINGAGSLADKLAAKIAADAAVEQFNTTNAKADANLTKAVDAAEEVIDTGFSNVVDDKETVSAAMQSALIADAKAKLTTEIADLQKEIDADKAAYLAQATPVATKTQLNAYLNAVVAKDAATKAATKASLAVTDTLANGGAKAVMEDELGGGAAITIADTGIANVVVGADDFDLFVIQSGQLVLNPDYLSGTTGVTGVTVPTAQQLTAAQDLLKKVIANQSAAEALKAATQTATDADVEVATGTKISATLTGDYADLGDNQIDLLKAKSDLSGIDSLVKAYKDALAVVGERVALEKVAEDAQKALDDAGVVLGNFVTGTTGGADLFIVDKATEAKTLNNFAAVDKIFAGKDYVLSTDITKGDDAKLEVFFKANGASTDVYIELKSFGSHTADAANGNADFAKITLTGVAADKLVLKDGFVQIAA